MKDNVTYRVIREFIDKDGNIDDFFFISASFSDYTFALVEANKAEVWKGNQISIWELLDGDLLNSWLIKEFPE